MIKVFFVLFAIAFSHTVLGKDNYNDALKKAGYNISIFTKADSLLDVFEMEKAIVALNAITTKKTLSKEQKIYAGVTYSKCYRLMYQFEKANSYLEELEKAKIIDTHAKNLLTCYYLDEKGLILLKLMRYSEAEKTFQHSLTIKQKILSSKHVVIGNSYFQLGELYYYRLEDYIQAELSFNKAFEIFTSNKMPDQHIFSDLYYNLAAIYYIKDDYKKAYDLLQTASKIENQTSVKEIEHFANIYNFRATLLVLMGDLPSALVSLETADKIRSTSKYPNYITLMSEKYNLALRYFENQKYDKAIEFINNQLISAPFSHPELKETPWNSILLMELARNYAQIGKKEAALIILKLHFNTLEAYYGHCSRSGILFYNKFANVFRTLGHFDQSIQILDKAIQCFSEDKTSDIITASIKASIYKLKANILLEKSGGKNLELMRMSIASFLYADSLNLVHKLNTPWQSSKINMGELNSYYYQEAIRACYLYFKISQNNYGLESAFKLMESNKAFTLRESLNQSLLFKINTLNAKEQEELKLLKQEILVLESNLKSDSSIIIQTKLEKLKLSLEAFYNKIGKDLISANTELFFKTKTNLKFVQKNLNPHQLLIMYHYQDSICYRMKISVSKIEFDTIQMGNEIEEMIRTFVDFTPSFYSAADIATFESKAYYLRKTLVGNLDKSTQSVIVVPDGPINNLPFSIFIDKKLDDKNQLSFSALNYWIKTKTIQYAYSVAQLFNQNVPPTNKKIKNGLGVFQKDDVAVFAKNEMRNLNRIIPDFERLYSDVNKEDLLSNFLDKDFIHMSLHGSYQAEEQNVVLQLSNGGSINGFDIGSMQLSSRLAFLNSCEGNIGDYKTGEGVFSMARYFMQAGCPTIVASIWKIPGNISAEISNYFYQNLAKNRSVTKALGEAQLKYLQDIKVKDELKHPYYWAGLIPIGVDQTFSIEKGIPLRIKIITGLLVIIGLIAVSLYYKRE
jgi:CHAT domain-containing protein/Flp pilus assembly protein TadD